VGRETGVQVGHVFTFASNKISLFVIEADLDFVAQAT
jgi:hypothetical protein